MSASNPWDLPDHCFEAPEFWVGGLAECNEFMAGLEGVEVTEIGRSAGGRPILAGAIGAKEPLERASTSLSSSMGGAGSQGFDREKLLPPSFFGETPHEKPVLILQGNIHGSEIAGTVAGMNALNVLVHGVDLRGRKQEPLREVLSKMRFVVIPHANPDGRAHWEPAKHLTGIPKDLAQFVTQGTLPDGTRLAWPSCKSIFPIPLGGQLGSYYNDAGVNLNHDRWLDADRAPETDALLSYYLDEMPDAVIMAHTDQGTLVGSAPPYVPAYIQGWHSRIGGAVYHAVREAGLPVFSYPHWGVAGGMTRAFTQADAVYHQCGAMPILCEFPSSTTGHDLTMATILDVGLAALAAMAAYGVEFGFRPELHKHLVDGRDITKPGEWW